MALTKEAYTGEKFYANQISALEKYLYNVGQRHPEEIRLQRIEGIPETVKRLKNLVNEVVKFKSREWVKLNKE